MAICGLRILVWQHCCCCQLLSQPIIGHHTRQARQQGACPAPLPKLIANELRTGIPKEHSTPSVHLSAKSMPTRTKCHPRAYPLFTLCYKKLCYNSLPPFSEKLLHKRLFPAQTYLFFFGSRILLVFLDGRQGTFTHVPCIPAGDVAGRQQQ